MTNSTLTIVLVGTETKKRKHVDWEIFSSMIDGKINKKSGVLVINLPTISCGYYTAAHGDSEKNSVYPDVTNWMSITSRVDFEDRYPYMPERIIDNLLKTGAKVSVANWSDVINNLDKFRFLIDVTFNDRASCEYDLSRPMRRKNS